MRSTCIILTYIFAFPHLIWQSRKYDKLNFKCKRELYRRQNDASCKNINTKLNLYLFKSTVPSVLIVNIIFICIICVYSSFKGFKKLPTYSIVYHDKINY